MYVCLDKVYNIRNGNEHLECYSSHIEKKSCIISFPVNKNKYCHKQYFAFILVGLASVLVFSFL